VIRLLHHLRASAAAMVAALVLFPAVTRLAQIGVPQNPAAFSGVHRSGVVPTAPQLAVPEDAGFQLHPPDPASHPADVVEIFHETADTSELHVRGLRAPPVFPG